MKTRSLFVVACLLLSASQTASAQPAGACKAAPAPVDAAPRLIEKPAFPYPTGQVTMLGEGWVRLAFTVTPLGEVANLRVVDIVGAPIFAHAAARSLKAARYSPAMLGGRPVAYNSIFDITYVIEGKNRAGVHAKIGGSYDAAAAARKFNDFERSLRILQEANKLTLNLYEYTLTSYGMAMSYLGLGDRRRALLQLRRTAIGAGKYVDKGIVRSTFALLAELEARDGSPRAALCAFETLKQKMPAYQPSQSLLDVLAGAERDLTGTLPVRTDAELVESGREEIPTQWSHGLLRDTFSFAALQGGVKTYRVTCPTTVIEGDVATAGTVRVGRSAGACTLDVLGDVGATISLMEQ
jgi:hypothetical protein